MRAGIEFERRIREAPTMIYPGRAESKGKTRLLYRFCRE